MDPRKKASLSRSLGPLQQGTLKTKPWGSLIWRGTHTTRALHAWAPQHLWRQLKKSGPLPAEGKLTFQLARFPSGALSHPFLCWLGGFGTLLRLQKKYGTLNFKTSTGGSRNSSQPTAFWIVLGVNMNPSSCEAYLAGYARSFDAGWPVVTL